MPATVLTLARACCAKAACSKPERQIIERRQMRIKSRVLKHHCDVAPVGRHIRDVHPIKQHAPRGRCFQARDQPQECTLARSRRPEHNEQFPLADRQVDGSPRSDRTGIYLRELADLDLGQCCDSF